MNNANLQQIRNKVRKITGRNSIQLPDSDVDFLINTYYTVDMPMDLQILKLDDIYTFNTQPNIDVYEFDSNQFFYTKAQFQRGAMCDGYSIMLTQDLGTFYSSLPRQQTHQSIGQSNGKAGPYTGSINAYPIYRSFNTQNIGYEFPYANPIGIGQMVMFTANMSSSRSLVGIDSPNKIAGTFGPNTKYEDTGTFIGDATGTINYITGDYEITFNEVPPAGYDLNAIYTTYAQTRPSSILIYQNQFRLSNPPDVVYKIEVPVLRAPTALAMDGSGPSSPEIAELWQMLAFGAALKVFEDNLDYEQMANIQATIRKYENRARSRGTMQQASTRNETIWDMGSIPNNAAFPITY